MKLFSIIILALLVIKSSEIIISETASKHLISVLSEFEKCSTDTKYHSPIPPSEEFPFPCHLLIFSPLDQYDIVINCPLHGIPLVVTGWTSDLKKENSKYNPRLIYCTNYNILLIQRYLRCSRANYPSHSYLSASKDIIEILPPLLSIPPIRIYKRSCYTHQLIEMIFELVGHGMNFQAITEIIGNNHYRYFESCKSKFGLTTNYLEDRVSCSPTPAKIQTVFLDVFQERKELYNDAIYNITPQQCLTADHTFKVGRNIGGYRKEDSKFVREPMQLYIVMDTTHSVVAWKIVQSGKFSEVKDLLMELKERCDTSTLDYIVLDNCCDMANMYRFVFDNLDMKLDLFHGVQRLTRVLPRKKSKETRKVMNDIGLIFRQKDDKGTSRLKSTPDVQEVLVNIEYFLKSNTEYFKNIEEKHRREFFDALKNLKLHVNKGCLSNVKPGDGTEANEGFHRILNYSCLNGVSKFGPELLIAILSVLMYIHNVKKKCRKHCMNSKIIPIPPMPAPKTFSNNTSKVEANTLPACSEEENPFVKELLKKIVQVQKFLLALENKCNRRNFKSEEILNHRILEQSHDLSSHFHISTLQRSCSSFKLTIKAMPKNGDCLFMAILDQLKNHEELNLAIVKDRVQGELNLMNGTSSVEQDVITLRSLFVDELISNETYRPFLLDDDIDYENYRNSGVFATNIGDFVVSVCSNILRMQIVVISSIKELYMEPFFPSHQVSEVPLFLAYNALESHYDSTSKLADMNLPVEFSGRCLCEPRHDITTCSNKSGYSSRCPCVKSNQPCNIECRCANCGNGKKPKQVDDKGCSCRVGGSSKATEGVFRSCCENESKRACRCPCFKSKKGCSFNCSCRKCGNMFGTRISLENDLKRSKRTENLPTSYKKVRTSEFMKENEMKLGSGTWTRMETIALYCISEELDLDTATTTSVYDVFETYEKLLSSPANSSIMLRKKTLRQILAKLSYMF